SNTSHTVSARRNIAAGVGEAKVKVTRRPSLSRRASTVAAFGPVTAGSGAIFFAASAAAAFIGSFAGFGAAGFGASAACIVSAGLVVSLVISLVISLAASFAGS